MVTVFVNNEKIELFHGATLKHALLKTDEQLYHDVCKKRAVIMDMEGNQTDLHGAVMSDWCYFVSYPLDN